MSFASNARKPVRLEATLLLGGLLLAGLVAGCRGASEAPSAAAGSKSSQSTAADNPQTDAELLDEALALLASRRGPNILEAIPRLELLASSEDPASRAPALVGLAEASALAGLYSLLPPNETMPRAARAARQALELSPDAASASAALGLSQYLWDWEFDEAQRSFELATRLEPRYANAHLWWAMLLSAIGQHEAATIRVQEARAAGNYSSRLMETKAVTILTAAGDFAAADAQSRSVLERYPDIALSHRERAFLELARAEAASIDAAQGHYASAYESFRRAAELGGGAARSTGGLAYAAGMLGREQEAQAALDALEKRAESEFVPPLYLALARLGLNETEAALEAVERALELHDPGLVYMRTRPGLRTLSGEPRYERVAAAVGV